MSRSLASLTLCVAGLFGAMAGAADPSSPMVRTVELLRNDLGRIEYSAQGDWLAFDKVAERGLYQIHVMKPDGSFERCLTCDHYDMRKANAFNPTWHPSGDFIVFQVQPNGRRMDMDPLELATGRRGLFSDLWVVDPAGKRIWQLTRVVEQGGAILDPRFSFEGDRLLWSQRMVSRVGRWGAWALHVAEFKTGKIPRLAKPKSYEPGRQKLFLAGSAFTPDDRGALFAGNREAGQNENGMDIYRLNFETQRAERLTHSRNAWDEKARVTAKGDRILWISAGDITLRDAGREPPLPLEQLRELWVMGLDGSDKQRLTFFNHPQADESLRAAVVDHFTQSPAGDEVLVHVIWPWRDRPREGVYRVTLDESFLR